MLCWVSLHGRHAGYRARCIDGYLDWCCHGIFKGVVIGDGTGIDTRVVMGDDVHVVICVVKYVVISAVINIDHEY